jgi:putative spermidine/putrescine transport system permease protein
MLLTRRTRAFLIAATALTLSFIYIPLLVVIINSFNPAKGFSWPPSSLSTVWWHKAAQNTGVRTAFVTSIKAGLGATLISLVLGSMIAFAVSRYRFFGRDVVSFLFILPIALPGIITGVALNSSFSVILPHLGISFGLFTVVLGHATFCIVVVFNNVVARLRRMGSSLEEASMDLGADVFTTFWRVTLPTLRGALVAGALLAFALSFDEIVVTTFTAGAGVQTLPLWIFNNLFRPTQAPIVNVVAAFLIFLFIIPVYLAQRLSEGSTRGRL